jgi:hypothetical protein
MAEATIGLVDNPDLPFVIVYVYLDVDKEAHKMKDFENLVLESRESLKEYISSLPGCMGRYRIGKGDHPSITRAEIKLKEEDNAVLNLQIKSLDEDSPNEIKLKTANEISLTQPLFGGDPFINHSKSLFSIDVNAHAIIGSFGGSIPYDSTNPYILMLTTGSWDYYWHGKDNLIIPFYANLYPYWKDPWHWQDSVAFLMLMDTWSHKVWNVISTNNQILSDVSEQVMANKSYTVGDSNLKVITRIGLEISALKIDLTRVQAFISKDVGDWSRKEFGPSLKEISIPFVDVDSNIEFKGQSGYLSQWAKSIKDNLEQIESTINAIRDQVDALSNYGNQTSVRESTSSSLRSSKSVESLTVLLLGFTLILVILEIGRDSPGLSEQVSQIISLLLIPVFLSYNYMRNKMSEGSTIYTSIMVGIVCSILIGYMFYLYSNEILAIIEGIIVFLAAMIICPLYFDIKIHNS